jgi:hypothetical protein
MPFAAMPLPHRHADLPLAFFFRFRWPFTPLFLFACFHFSFSAMLHFACLLRCFSIIDDITPLMPPYY